MTTTAMTSPPNSVAPSISSIDPQLLKLLARHHHQLHQQQQQQPSAKEFVQHAYYFNHPPPNTVATNLPRHLLGNGLSKLNTENSTKFSLSSNATINGKIDQQQLPTSSQIKKVTIQQAKEAHAFDQWLQPPLGSIIQGPPCLQADTSSSSSAIAAFKSETTLSSGERITCFIVGGEKRLCLPEILNTVLKDFSLQEINSACERLHIYCSRCTNEQLDVLKMTQVLPLNAPSCGLITQTDAERLCANLLQLRYKGQLRTVNSLTINQYERLYSMKVQHKCFGKCSGTLYPTLYIGAQAECIQCDTCQALFSPKTFVSHGHKSEENRICHWGFNSDNWRAYLKIRSTEDNKAREELELFKEKFSFNNNLNQKKRLSQQLESLIPAEKRAKLMAPSSEGWLTNGLYSYPQTTFSSTKKDNHTAEYSFTSCLPRPSLIPPSLPTEPTQPLTSCVRSSSLRVVCSNSPPSNEPTNPSITNFSDFSQDGIREIVESTVSSSRGRHQLIRYICQLQLAAYAHSSKTNCVVSVHQQGETILLRRENEFLRERLSKFEATQISSDSSPTSNESKISSSDHNHQQDCILGDLDDLDSNVSSYSTSSIIAHETMINEQPKYFDRKRRLLAGEQQIATSQTEILMTKKCSPHKKACLDQIVDSLNQKAQAEHEEKEDEDEEEEEEEEGEIDEQVIKEKEKENNDEEEIVIESNNSLRSTEREDEDEDEEIDIDDAKLVDDDH